MAEISRGGCTRVEAWQARTYLSDAFSKRTTRKDVRQSAACAYTGLVIDDLNHTIAAASFEGPSEAGDIRGWLRFAFLKALVRVHPCTVAANEKTLLLRHIVCLAEERIVIS